MNVISAMKTVFNVDDNLITGGDDKSGSDNKAKGTYGHHGILIKALVVNLSTSRRPPARL